MKKRLLVIGLAIAIVMCAIMPASVIAADSENKNSRNVIKDGAFKADGSAMVVGAGTITSQKMLGKNIVLIKRTSEVIAGDILSCAEWPEFAGTQYQIIEDATTTLNIQTGKFNSVAVGTITVFKGGAPVMTGKYGAFMYGGFSLNANGEPLFSNVIDNGVIELKGVATTAFENIGVKGTVTATLVPVEIYPGVYTLGGPLTINGKRS